VVQKRLKHSELRQAERHSIMYNSIPRRLPRYCISKTVLNPVRSYGGCCLINTWVLEAADPLNGLQLAEETRPNLILIDQNLPHMMGSERRRGCERCCRRRRS